MDKYKWLKNPITVGALLFIVLTFGSTFGYMLIDDYSFMNGLFMTIITLTTVGYGEPQPLSNDGELFTIIVMLVCMLYVSYLVTYTTTYIVTGKAKADQLERKIKRKMEKLSNHIIVCGYGLNGQQVADELLHQNPNLQIVIVDNDENKSEYEYRRNMYFIHGDATKDDVLKKAGIATAGVLITTISSDSENLYIVITARGLNKEIKIISKAYTSSYETKMKRAGANEVILPFVLSGQKMAQEAIATNSSK
ncbi:MAG: potassium channel family protein [Marinifilaceae bacterium]